MDKACNRSALDNPLDSINGENGQVDPVAGGSPIQTPGGIAYQNEGYVDPEEGSNNSLEEIKVLKEIAEDARISAEASANKAELLAGETKDKLDEDDLNGANEKIIDASLEFQNATDAANIAEDAAVRAKSEATIANNYAIKDPAAEPTAQEAINEALLTVEEYDLARAARDRAYNAYSNANQLKTQYALGTDDD